MEDSQKSRGIIFSGLIMIHFIKEITAIKFLKILNFKKLSPIFEDINEFLK